MRIEKILDALASQAIATVLETDAPALVRPTQHASHGDYQVNGVLPLAKRLSKNPRELAAPVAAHLAEDPRIASAEVAGPGFINLRVSETWLAELLREAWADKAREGIDPAEHQETIVVDYSSPNIAKQMHVGHLRSTIIGASLVELHRALGHHVIADNHLGDWGTQFGLMIVGIREYGDEEKLASEPLEELLRVYTVANDRAKNEPAFAEAARSELAKLQSGDADNLALWKRTVALSKTALEGVYDRLGVSFDEWLGESAYNDRLAGVVEQLKDAGLAREDQGAICVFFNELEGADPKLKKREVPFIVQKGDGAFLYSTSDIATVQYRRERWNADRALYVVDKRQGDHFTQLFEVVRLLGETMKLEHVGFGTVMGDDGKPIRTRDGGALLLTALLDEAEERAERKMIEELGLDAELARSLRSVIGIGAVKYADLMQNRTTDYKFDWDKLIAFNGNAGPYNQYTHARLCSILRTAEEGGVVFDPGAAALPSPITLDHPAERTLALRLVRFGDAVRAAADGNLPHLVAEHVYNLASEGAAFYTQCPVLKSESPLRESRLALVDLTRRQLAKGLALLGIGAPDRM
ncbi:MAG: arginine--tRNA ligase [Sandaracinaceae bacterium]